VRILTTEENIHPNSIMTKRQHGHKLGWKMDVPPWSRHFISM